MELHVLLWILGGGFAGTWGLCIYFMNRADAMMHECRREISELKNCIKDHHARLCVIEEKKERK